MTKMPLVSVIVPTFNSAAFLEQCLRSIQHQTYKKLEIIVVDNYSTDATKKIALKFTDKVFTKGPERSAQVNFGVSKASGEYIYKVDSDFVLDKNVVAECIEAVRQGYAAVAVHNSPDARISWIARIRKFEVDMYKYNLTHSSARFIKRSVFQAIGGFNEDITAGEDYDLQNKLNRGGYKTAFVQAEALHLGEPTNFWRHMLKYYSYGKDFNYYQQANQSESKKQIFNFFRGVYFKNWQHFVRHPLLGAGFVGYNAVKYMFGGLGWAQAKISIASVTRFAEDEDNALPIRLTRWGHVLFYAQYVWSKLVLIWFEVKTPKLGVFLYELLYSGGKLVGYDPNKSHIFSISKLTTRHGTFAIRPGTNDLACASPAFERPDMLENYSVLKRLLRSDRNVLFLDIGADFGSYSVAVANYFREYKNLHIHAFEPASASYALLQENIKINRAGRKITTHNVALYKLDNATLTFVYAAATPGSSGIAGHSGDETSEVQEVKAMTLNTVLGDGIKKYDSFVLKIDVEGAEADVLKGASKLLSSGKEIYLLVEDFVDPAIMTYLLKHKAKPIKKLTPYNSWWRIT